ncbi:coiled-coil domain-containing protein 9 isoform X2 [Lepisosteus oculatus]|uniref:coiled-coil domain-containing protein 9 isoform X2 n=1 Tax=Lepisosteus oculatus TaxID=7918 RepID=UPI00371FBE65
MPHSASSRLEGAQFSPLTSKMHRPNNSPDVMFKKKEQKDAELDKKIEALRKKNEALMKRYQEVEEDKKRAEEEGMAFLSRRAKAEDLTITIKKSPNEARVVTKKPGSGSPLSLRGGAELPEGDVGLTFHVGRGRRRQLLVTMANKNKGKRIVSEKMSQNRTTSPVGLKGFFEEEENKESAGTGRQIPFSKALDNKVKEEERQDFENLIDETEWLAECDPYFQDAVKYGPKAHADLDVLTFKEEQMEYIRWKKEREQIDRERVARHKNAKGQWRRAWDIDKTENMFREKFISDGESGNRSQNRVGRNPRKFNPRLSDPETRGYMHRNREKASKNVPVVSSKAKGKDRLTGRARRWDAKEEHLQSIEKSSEDVCEDQEALGNPEVDEPTLNTNGKDWDVKNEQFQDSDTATMHDIANVQGIEESKRCAVENSETVCCQGQQEMNVGVAGAAHRDKVLVEDVKSNRLVDAEALPQRVKENHKSAQVLKEINGPPHKTDSTSPPETALLQTLKDVSYNRDVHSVAEGHQTSPTLTYNNISEKTDSQQQSSVVSKDFQKAATVHCVNQADNLLSNRRLTDEIKKENVFSEDSVTDLAKTKSTSETECLTSDSGMNYGNVSRLTVEDKADKLSDHFKNNNTRSPEEIIDSSLSVMSPDSGASVSAYKATTVKANENGKSV